MILESILKIAVPVLSLSAALRPWAQRKWSRFLAWDEARLKARGQPSAWVHLGLVVSGAGLATFLGAAAPLLFFLGAGVGWATFGHLPFLKWLVMPLYGLIGAGFATLQAKSHARLARKHVVNWRAARRFYVPTGAGAYTRARLAASSERPG
jgi:hypothetical protein